MSKNKSRQSFTIKPRVALCYIRQSYTRDGDEKNSPERQRANIERVCDRYNWIPEWHEDVGGHKSGRYEKGRPAWLKLKERIEAPDVVAIVANDLGRLHRNLTNISSLIEMLEQTGLELVLAASDTKIDVSTVMGQMFAQFSGLLDAYYAKDISLKAKDSIRHRKRQGKVVGIPPFGTIRNDKGYLIPITTGAWLLPDGHFVGGAEDETPEGGIVWRGYYECAKTILTTYATNQLGLERIAYHMNDEGWAFRDRWGNPRPVTRDDIRRVVGNWSEYGGMVIGTRGKDRRAYENDVDLDAIPFIEERATMPLDLLQRVATVRRERTIKPREHGVNRVTHPYILRGLVYCSHCDDVAQAQNNIKLRSRLGGTRTRANSLRYRHKAGVKCGVHNRSVLCHELEADFGKLIKLMTIKEDALDLMMELALQADRARGTDQPDVDPEEERQKAIALCKRRIEAAKDLYLNGELDRDDYWKRVQDNEREITHWETRTTETEKAALQLAICVDLLHNISEAWELGDNEERKALAESLFTEVIYNLDTRQIVDFRLKPMFDRFVELRADVYSIYENNQPLNEENGASGNKEGSMSESTKQMVWQDVGARPLGGIEVPTS